ncbi:hypothetical protein [Pandoraea sputorum]|uniref:Uncharacterized protein n=1 Tax=Pandoraea sputorum TaxID=93222 RepID=A0A5E5BKG4_9BURK|nr:hypothetical protein [Pandoraea sputorum]VVE85848.1 hypothetical protein PSP31121_05479 [Pandoraea sputorum]
MARAKGKDIGIGRWSDNAARRQWRLHKEGEPSSKEDPTVRRPPELAKCEGHFVWSVRQAAFIGRDDDARDACEARDSRGLLKGGVRHYVPCTARAQRYGSVAQARAAGDALVGDVLIMYGYAANGPLYIVGR